MNRDIACAFLTAAGHAATAVSGGAEAVAAVASAPFDVVLMDVSMPDIDGLEATRRIRVLPGAAGQVPIIGLTAQAFTEQRRACLEAGMSSHLAKPYAPDALNQAVRAAAGDA
jgi:CheY-like chemotaxis protein